MCPADGVIFAIGYAIGFFVVLGCIVGGIGLLYNEETLGEHAAEEARNKERAAEYEANRTTDAAVREHAIRKIVREEIEADRARNNQQ